ncbi:uncharacterized protein EAF01_003717 [Botrytis porri]|uniref:uncharacterized protein n=1 Tax=Botrytis porri TaxID=87229 RepID=UPI00190250A7|nr:uncharacterized protein EAF01_003717 [Botrytis porri]KAF7909999.1 hypothetical protein EAF01_003717 [Botrytis porri]
MNDTQELFPETTSFQETQPERSLEGFLQHVNGLGNPPLLTTSSMVTLLSLSEKEEHLTRAQVALNRWLEYDTMYEAPCCNNHDAEFARLLLSQRSGPDPAPPERQYGFDPYFEENHKDYCNRPEIKMGILDQTSYTSMESEWDFSINSIRSLECCVEASKDSIVPIMIALKVVQKLVHKSKEECAIQSKRTSHDYKLADEMLQSATLSTQRRSALRTNIRRQHKIESTRISMDNANSQINRASSMLQNMQNRTKYLGDTLSTINNTKSRELGRLMLFVKRVKFAKERLVLKKRHREAYLPAETWYNILERVIPNGYNTNVNGKPKRSLERWMISKTLFQTAVLVYYKKTMFWCTPDIFMKFSAFQNIRNITINLWSSQWNTHAIGSKCVCHLPRTIAAVETYDLQQRLKECTSLLRLRFIIGPCGRIEGSTTVRCISLSNAALLDLQRWGGPCGCCIFSKKSNKCSSHISVVVDGVI